ncbi:hypothetical protein BHU72_07760 [Desulfuribacillus stibiiarsenatis]|uniref:YggT family protein n=1 Tax=Desulfuribacillus stibiiarsenatis TaxID=1390249 RepID=A0A1E5L3X7_9FIRM|nr:hypothetical protein BHU72_07760 [Desulfuribacillus stibiiarsenatis]
MAILDIVALLFRLYWYILIARIIMSWVPSLYHTKFGETVYNLTEPYLSMFRGFIPPISLGGGYLDVSPIIAFLAYHFIQVGALSIIRWILITIGFM